MISNPTLVHKVDELAVENTGRTGNDMTLDLPCKNKQLTVVPLTICMLNGEIITSTHTTLLSKTDLPIEARKAHLFPCPNRVLLLIRTFCDHGCQSVLDDKTVIILNKGNGKIMMKGKRYPLSNLYMLNFTQRNDIMTEFQTPDKYFVGSVNECKSKVILVDYHHTSCWIFTQSGWVKSIKKNLLTSWTLLSSDFLHKYLTNKQSTLLGHLQQPQKVLQSMQTKELQSEPEPDLEPEPEQFPPFDKSEGTNLFFLNTVDLTGKIYTYQTGSFPITARKGNKYILVA